MVTQPSSAVWPVPYTCAQPYHQGVLLRYLSKKIPVYLSDKIEMVQKRALCILFPETCYSDALSFCNITRLDTRRGELCLRMWHNTRNHPESRLYHLLYHRSLARQSSSQLLGTGISPTGTRRTAEHRQSSSVQHRLFSTAFLTSM